MDAFINYTTCLHSTRGVVHIEGVSLDPEEGYINLEFDARALLNDLPHLYSMCKQAIKQDEEYQHKKFVEFTKTLKEEYKGKRGRPTRK